MLQAKAEAAGALCGTGRAPRCGRAVGVAALAWRGAAVNAQRWPRSCASSCARQSGAIAMHAPIGAVLPVPGQGAGRAAPS